MLILLRPIFYITLALYIFGCSLAPPGVKVTMNKLVRSDVAYYIVEDEMEGVLTVLNRDGEAVVKAKYFDQPVLIKIFATDDQGIVVQQFDPDTWELLSSTNKSSFRRR